MAVPSACPAPAIQKAEQRCAALSAMPGPGWAPSIPARGRQLALGSCPADRKSLWELDVHALYATAQLSSPPQP